MTFQPIKKPLIILAEEMPPLLCACATLQMYEVVGVDFVFSDPAYLFLLTHQDDLHPAKIRTLSHRPLANHYIS